MNIDLKSLIEKMNKTSRIALDAAISFCDSQRYYQIEIEHFLLKLLDLQDSDLSHILRYFGIDQSRFTTELHNALGRLEKGSARAPFLSRALRRMLSTSWLIGSLDFGAPQLRSGFAVAALVSDEELIGIVEDFSAELSKIEPEALRRDFMSIVAGSPESPSSAVADFASRTPSDANQPNLDQYTVDLTSHARAGKIDQVLGRDSEIRQIVDILMRRRQNNPILTGEAGVGKTAVVEGFALRVANGDVPAPLHNVVVRTLDLALLQAGAGVKGEFENRLKGLIEEVKNSPVPIILFIDEAHTLIGAGGQAGQNDAANVLKPALARGELRTIAATTWSEYKKYFEKDPALARRFQIVKVEEPGEGQCMVMLRGIVTALEQHHQVRILDEGLAAAVTLSHRYLAGRQLPDKAVSVLDTACARLALGQNMTPPAIERLNRQLDDLEVQERILRREVATGSDHGERLATIQTDKATLKQGLDLLVAKWERTASLLGEIRDLRRVLEDQADGPSQDSPALPAMSYAAAASGAMPSDGAPQQQGIVPGMAEPPDTDDLRRKLAQLSTDLDELQGEEVLTRVCVDAQIVGEVISGWTGIPLGKMVKDELQTILDLESHLGRRVLGQSHALTLISQRIRTGRATLDDPGKPLGVFLLVGPSGVGKTETALALSDLLYGGEQNLITINMSEFQELHTISTLKGSPPGYVGYGEGGVLTEAVRRRPYSVVLLDEVEKAHIDVLELFYQVFDRGVMEDGEGREINFKNTIILLTTNACTDQICHLTRDPENLPSTASLVGVIKPVLNEIFKPALLGRLVIVPYYPIRDEALQQIVELKLEKIKRRMSENHKIDLTYHKAVVDEIVRLCVEVESGARNIDNVVTNTLLPDLSRRLLTSIAESRKLAAVHVGWGPDNGFEYTLQPL